jgi:hypothetical protein
MQLRIHRGLVNALFIAVVAAMIVVPIPAAADCTPAGDVNCCCKNQNRTACDVGASRTCHCQRTPAPQNTPPERTTVPTPPSPVALLPADAAQFHGGVEFAATFQAAPDGHLAAIPHRILHCSWLV